MSKESFKNFVRQNPELADYVIENYVPMSVIKGIKAEIKSLMKEQETHFDVLEVGANRAFCRTLSIIDRHIREGRARQKVKQGVKNDKKKSI